MHLIEILPYTVNFAFIQKYDNWANDLPKPSMIHLYGLSPGKNNNCTPGNFNTFCCADFLKKKKRKKNFFKKKIFQECRLSISYSHIQSQTRQQFTS